jgi:hypothetical protein
LQKGTQVGGEVGFYAGFLSTLAKLEDAEALSSTSRSSKFGRVSTQLRRLVDRFILGQTVDVDVVEQLQEMRGKFKVLQRLLGLRRSPSATLSF